MSSGTLTAGDAPRILVLDDEEVQRKTVRHQLFDVGTFIDFGDPRTAISYLRNNSVDAVIVDVRMPNLPVDGLWFLTQLREFDKHLGVVLRTGDADIAIAQAGIEARAIQRVIKSEPGSRVRLRTAVQTAIQETRERRRMADAAATAERTRGELVTALGRMDSEITVAEMCRGFAQGLTNFVATVAGYSELFVEHAATAGDATLAEIAGKNRVAASRLSAQVREFLSNPCLEGMQSPGSATRANACVEALNQIFRNHPLFASGNARFSGRGVLPDVALSVNPARTVTALRHLVEYCALRVQSVEAIALTASLCSDADAHFSAEKRGMVINGRSAGKRAGVVFEVQASIGSPAFEVVRDDLRQCSIDPRVGNLLMVGATIIDDRLTFGVSHSAKGVTTFALFIPTTSLS